MQNQSIMVSGQFESARVHPRRRPVINTSLTPEAESSSSKMQLKKGETFNTPTNPPSSDRDPVLNIRSLPRRSPTSLDAIAASEQRMASILERLTLDDQPEDNSSSVDTLEGLRSVHEVNAEAKSAISTPSTPSSEDGYDLFPLDKKEQQQQQNQQHQRDQDHDHESDSGLGSSVSSRESQADPTEKDLHMEQSPITKSASDFLQGTTPRRQLSYVACKKIERYILVPILKEPKLKPFHPLVRSIPTRIVNKQVVCLRDLEKILLWLAPVSPIFPLFVCSIFPSSFVYHLHLPMAALAPHLCPFPFGVLFHSSSFSNPHSFPILIISQLSYLSRPSSSSDCAPFPTLHPFIFCNLFKPPNPSLLSTPLNSLPVPTATLFVSPPFPSLLPFLCSLSGVHASLLHLSPSRTTTCLPFSHIWRSG
jgi:hypothetical protein